VSSQCCGQSSGIAFFFNRSHLRVASQTLTGCRISGSYRVLVLAYFSAALLTTAPLVLRIPTLTVPPPRWLHHPGLVASRFCSSMDLTAPVAEVFPAGGKRLPGSLPFLLALWRLPDLL
jgi:hypothetical protein